MKEMKIGNRIIGPGHTPLVIAELGINHNGSLKTAFEMVDAAAQAGAEIIKHQTHVVEDEMSHAAKNVIPGNSDDNIYNIMEKSALNEEDEIKLKEYVEAKGMIFMSTPFSRAAADRLERMGVLAYKIGSGEMNNYPLLNHIASFGKPMIVSTGMNDMDSVRKAVSVLEKNNVQYALLHTTNVYPTPPEIVRLGAMQQLMAEFPDIIVGLSDHTVNNNACLAAVAQGALILERHFTDRKDRPGPDIVNSMDPIELKQLIIGADEISKMLGGEKKAVAEEQVTIDFAFATVVTIQPIAEGETLTEENIWVKRPGTGEILAEHYEELLGKTVNKDLDNDTQLSWQDMN